LPDLASRRLRQRGFPGKDRRRADGVAEAALAKELQVLRNAFNIAMNEWEWIETTPFLKVKIEVPKNGVERYLTPEEEKQLLGCCPDWLKETVVSLLTPA